MNDKKRMVNYDYPKKTNAENCGGTGRYNTEKY